MMSIEEIIKRLDGKNYSEIARKSRLTRSYVSAIASGKHLNPRYETVRKISEAIYSIESNEKSGG